MKITEYRHRVGALMAQYQLVDRTISQRSVTVTHKEDETDHIAYTDGENIVFGIKALNQDVLSDSQKLVALDGLNYHELCHILYTPRHRDLPDELVNDSNRRMAYNALEDQRIETIFTMLYPSTKMFFRTAVLHHILDASEGELDSTFALLYGRKYLFKKIIKSVEDTYAIQKNIPELKDVIDEYIALDGVVKNDPKLYISLVDRYLKLLPKDKNGEPKISGTTLFGHTFGEDDKSHQDMNRGRQIAIDISQVKSGKASGDGIPVKIDLDGESKKSDQDGDADDKSDKKSKDKGKDNSSPGSGSAKSDAKDVAQKELDETMQEQEIINYVRTTHRHLSAKNGKIYGNTIAKARVRKSMPTAQMNNLVSKVSEKYRPLVEDADPNYEQYQSYGRINIDRVMRNMPVDTVFDRWNEGQQDATDLELIIGLDVSGSMGGREQELGEIAWILKRGLSSLGERCNVSVMTYSDETREIYSRESVAGSAVLIPEIWGGTTPKDFFDYCEHVFANTNRSHKIMAMMTDGEWFKPHNQRHISYDEMMDNLNHAGVITGLYHFGYGRNTHRAQVFHSSPDLSGLIRFSENLVDLSLRNKQ